MTHERNPTRGDTPDTRSDERAALDNQQASRPQNEQAARPRDDGRHDTDLDDDRTDQRLAAQRDANRQAAEADPQGEAQIDHGSHARAGMGKARQSDGS